MSYKKEDIRWFLFSQWRKNAFFHKYGWSISLKPQNKCYTWFLKLNPLFLKSFFLILIWLFTSQSSLLKTKNSDFNTLHTETPLLHPSSYTRT